MTDYKDTIFLPQTEFPMRANLPQREPDVLKHWQSLDIYQKLRDLRAGATPFIYHDGPPYANGNIHAGHAVGKILRDAVVRSQAMAGKQISFIPGWDCHGLPIEWKVEEKYRAKKQNKDDVPVLEFREECRQFAKKWVDIQREEFKRLGVNANWDDPYLTMNFKSEATIYRELTKFVLNGALYRGLRPVMWSVVEKTALADAEVEYHDHTSKTVFAAFPVKSSPVKDLKDASIIIWTTTAWTLPANRAVAYGEALDYVAVKATKVEDDALIEKDRIIVVGKDLLEDVMKAAKISDVKLVKKLKGSDLAETICHHPLHDKGYDFDVPVLPGDFVTTDAGTGFVHIAPSHGEDDFNLGRQHDLPTPEMVDDGGVYVEDVPLFAGTHVFKAHEPVTEAIREAGNLLATESLVHSYPHSWRSKAPLIFRATPQWFISMDKTGLRETALQAIEDTRWLPSKGYNRIKAIVETGPDWCISRQRTWGVPIAIFVHKKTNEVLRDEAVLNRIVEAFEKDGADVWYTTPAQDFLGSTYNADDYDQIMDVVDVWFESGATHAFVLEDREDADSPADLYLEGSDQHRGWFRSSLLESCGTRGKAPYKAVLTHGFVNDEKGYKMSKSKGNVVAPQDIIDQFGADVLRLWALSIDWTDDMRIGQEMLKQASESYRRFRNTLRFILGNLADFSEDEILPADQMPELERWVLHRLTQIDASLQNTINDYDFLNFVSELYLFCHQDLSAFYFDIRKDTLYCSAPDSLERRACRTVLNTLFDCLTKWLAPILAFTAEEAWLSRSQNPDKDSIHLQTYPKVDKAWKNDTLADKWEKLRDIRSVVTGALEIERTAKRIGSSLQAHPHLYVSADYEDAIQDQNLSELTITSNITVSVGEAPADAFILPEVKGIGVVAKPAEGSKCERCWMVLPDVGSHADHPGLCDRCYGVIANLKTPKQAAG